LVVSSAHMQISLRRSFGVSILNSCFSMRGRQVATEDREGVRGWIPSPRPCSVTSRRADLGRAGNWEGSAINVLVRDRQARLMRVTSGRCSRVGDGGRTTPRYTNHY
jgi:hypothetical protein